MHKKREDFGWSDRNWTQAVHSQPLKDFSLATNSQNPLNPLRSIISLVVVTISLLVMKQLNHYVTRADVLQQFGLRRLSFSLTTPLYTSKLAMATLCKRERDRQSLVHKRRDHGIYSHQSLKGFSLISYSQNPLNLLRSIITNSVEIVITTSLLVRKKVNYHVGHSVLQQ